MKASPKFTAYYEQVKKRFWAKVNCGKRNRCWPWQGCVKDGYGQTSLHARHMATHRLAYFLAHKELPEGQDILHRCGLRTCCNPAHLYPGDDKQNAADRDRHGRTPRGEERWCARLTWRIVWATRIEYFFDNSYGAFTRIARKFNLSRPERAREIILYKKWRTA
jgi:hypothetical protein